MPTGVAVKVAACPKLLIQRNVHKPHRFVHNLIDFLRARAAMTKMVASPVPKIEDTQSSCDGRDILVQLVNQKGPSDLL